MKASELRIGNYVLKHNEFMVKATALKGLYELFEDLEKGLIKPVPLTKELLLKFGFYESDKRRNRFIEENLDFEIEFQGNEVAYCLWDADFPSLTHFIGHCKYVHSLQNLYFALTGEELILSN